MEIKNEEKAKVIKNFKTTMDKHREVYKLDKKKIKKEEKENEEERGKHLGIYKNRGIKRADILCPEGDKTTLCEEKDTLIKRLQDLDADAWEKVNMHKKYAKYVKMRKIGIPDGAIRLKMKQDGVPVIKFSLFNGEEVDKFLSKISHESMIEKETHGHMSPVHSILKTLVAAMGKNSPGAKKGREDLQRLLKKYPDKVPSAIIEIITDKIRAHGLGLIFGIQAASTIAGLLISIIPIPGMGVIGEGFAITGDGFIDAIEVLKPDGIFKMLSSYEEKIFKILEKYGTLISGMLSGIGCCSKDQEDLNKNLDNFGTIVSELIKDVDADKTVDAKGIVKKIQEFMKKTTEEKIDTKKLTNLAEEIKSEKKSSAAPAGATASLNSPAAPNPQQGAKQGANKGANKGGKRRSRRGKRVYNKQTCKKNTRKKNKRNKRTKKRKKRRKTRRKKRKRN